MLVHLGAWGRRYLPTTPELAIRQQLLEEGGRELWQAFMAELSPSAPRHASAGGARERIGTLQAAFDEMAAQSKYAGHPE